MTWLLLKLVRGYQLLISPVLGSNCRFYPTCSSYMLQAIELHGPVRGTWLGLKRIGRCHPWHAGGVDPVPGSEAERLMHEADARELDELSDCGQDNDTSKH